MPVFEPAEDADAAVVGDDEHTAHNLTDESEADPSIDDHNAKGAAHETASSLAQRLRVPAAAFALGAVLASAVCLGVPAVQDSIDAGTDSQLGTLAQDYAAALTQGDFGEAAQMAAFDPSEAGVWLLEQGVYPSSPPRVECGTPVRTGDVADAPCEIQVVQGTVVPRRLMFERRDGSWRISEGLASPIALDTPLVRVAAIDGVAIEEAVSSGELPVWLFPGLYDVDLDVPPVVEVSAVEGLIVSGSGAVLQGEIESSPAVQQEANAAAVAYVTECAERGGAGCPPVQPLVAGESFTVTPFGVAYGSNLPDGFLQQVVVGRTASPDQYDVLVAVEFSDDYGDYELTPGTL